MQAMNRFDCFVTRGRALACVIALAVSACAVIAAAPAALATTPTNFVANFPHRTISPERPAKASGTSEGPQVFEFGPVTIKCQHAPYPTRQSVGPTTSSTARLESETPTELIVSVHFEKCGRIVGGAGSEEFEPVQVRGKANFGYHINGFVSIYGAGEGEEQEYETDPVTIRETALTFRIRAREQCTVIIPEQDVPIEAEVHPGNEFSAFAASNVFTPTTAKGFTNNEKESLNLENNFKGLLYQFAEDTQCYVDQPHKQGNDGTYTGLMHLQLPAGNLGVAE